MRICDLKKFHYIVSIKKNFYKKEYLKLISILTLSIIPSILFENQILTDTLSNQLENKKDIKNYQLDSEPKWEIIYPEKKYEKGIFWEKLKDNSNILFINKEVINKNDLNQKNSNDGIGSLNRSIVLIIQ